MRQLARPLESSSSLPATAPLTVRNLDPWYPAFDVQPGQALHFAPAERVRVW